MYKERKDLYKRLAKMRNSNVISYITSTRQGQSHEIENTVLNFFPFHLDALKSKKEKITLFLHTDGGDIITAWAIVNLLRMFCCKLEVIVPSRAMSAGTIICLGADKILMTKQAVLGPIDPSVNSPYNPIISNTPLPISVENVDNYFKLAEDKLGKNANYINVFTSLLNYINPIALGNVYRVQNQIRMLSKKLLRMHMSTENDDTVNRIIDFLCSTSGSHDYKFYRNEAIELGLPIEIPNTNLYKLINSIYLDICNEMKLHIPFYTDIERYQLKNNDNYKYVRGLLESTDYGSHKYIYSGTISSSDNNFSHIASNLSWIQDKDDN